MITVMNRAKHTEYPATAGFISIFSVLIIMSVLTLIAVGFSSITRQAQRRTLDAQLNTQAFYAAESGINDARRALETTPNINKTTCKTTGDGYKYDVDSTLGVGYTCLLIDSEPIDFKYDSVPVQGTGEPVVTQFDTDEAVRKVVFSWDSSVGKLADISDENATASPTLPKAEIWGGDVGILRVDLVPKDSLNRADLVNRGYTFFLYPTTGSGGSTSIGVVNGTADKAGTLFTKCDNNAETRCTGTLELYATHMPGNIPTSKSYMLRLQSFYNPTRVRIQGLDAAGVAMKLKNGQAVVDSTGKANDVFRRIRVRLPLNAVAGMHESFGLLSGDSICKRLITAPNNTEPDRDYNNTITHPECSIGL